MIRFLYKENNVLVVRDESHNVDVDLSKVLRNIDPSYLELKKFAFGLYDWYSVPELERAVDMINRSLGQQKTINLHLLARSISGLVFLSKRCDVDYSELARSIIINKTNGRFDRKSVESVCLKHLNAKTDFINLWRDLSNYLKVLDETYMSQKPLYDMLMRSISPLDIEHSLNQFLYVKGEILMHGIKRAKDLNATAIGFKMQFSSEVLEKALSDNDDVFLIDTEAGRFMRDFYNRRPTERSIIKVESELYKGRTVEEITNRVEEFSVNGENPTEEYNYDLKGRINWYNWWLNIIKRNQPSDSLHINSNKL